MTAEITIQGYAMERYRHIRISNPDTWRAMIADGSIVAHCRSVAATATIIEARLRSGVVGAFLSSDQAADIVQRFLRD